MLANIKSVSLSPITKDDFKSIVLSLMYFVTIPKPGFLVGRFWSSKLVSIKTSIKLILSLLNESIIKF